MQRIEEMYRHGGGFFPVYSRIFSVLIHYLIQNVQLSPSIRIRRQCVTASLAMYILDFIIQKVLSYIIIHVVLLRDKLSYKTSNYFLSFVVLVVSLYSENTNTMFARYVKVLTTKIFRLFLLCLSFVFLLLFVYTTV